MDLLKRTPEPSVMQLLAFYELAQQRSGQLHDARLTLVVGSLVRRLIREILDFQARRPRTRAQIMAFLWKQRVEMCRLVALAKFLLTNPAPNLYPAVNKYLALHDQNMTLVADQLFVGREKLWNACQPLMRVETALAVLSGKWRQHGLVKGSDIALYEDFDQDILLEQSVDEDKMDTVTSIAMTLGVEQHRAARVFEGLREPLSQQISFMLLSQQIEIPAHRHCYLTLKRGYLAFGYRDCFEAWLSIRKKPVAETTSTSDANWNADSYEWIVLKVSLTPSLSPGIYFISDDLFFIVIDGKSSPLKRWQQHQLADLAQAYVAPSESSADTHQTMLIRLFDFLHNTALGVKLESLYTQARQSQSVDQVRWVGTEDDVMEIGYWADANLPDLLDSTMKDERQKLALHKAHSRKFSSDDLNYRYKHAFRIRFTDQLMLEVETRYPLKQPDQLEDQRFHLSLVLEDGMTLDDVARRVKSYHAFTILHMLREFLVSQSEDSTERSYYESLVSPLKMNSSTGMPAMSIEILPGKLSFWISIQESTGNMVVRPVYPDISVLSGSDEELKWMESCLCDRNHWETFREFILLPPWPAERSEDTLIGSNLKWRLGVERIAHLHAYLFARIVSDHDLGQSTVSSITADFKRFMRRFPVQMKQGLQSTVQCLLWRFRMPVSDTFLVGSEVDVWVGCEVYTGRILIKHAGIVGGQVSQSTDETWSINDGDEAIGQVSAYYSDRAAISNILKQQLAGVWRSAIVDLIRVDAARLFPRVRFQQIDIDQVGDDSFKGVVERGRKLGAFTCVSGHPNARVSNVLVLKQFVCWLIENGSNKGYEAVLGFVVSDRQNAVRLLMHKTQASPGLCTTALVNLLIARHRMWDLLVAAKGMEGQMSVLEMFEPTNTLQLLLTGKSMSRLSDDFSIELILTSDLGFCVSWQSASSAKSFSQFLGGSFKLALKPSSNPYHSRYYHLVDDLEDLLNETGSLGLVQDLLGHIQTLMDVTERAKSIANLHRVEVHLLSRTAFKHRIVVTSRSRDSPLSMALDIVFVKVKAPGSNKIQIATSFKDGAVSNFSPIGSGPHAALSPSVPSPSSAGSQGGSQNLSSVSGKSLNGAMWVPIPNLLGLLAFLVQRIQAQSNGSPGSWTLFTPTAAFITQFSTTEKSDVWSLDKVSLGLLVNWVVPLVHLMSWSPPRTLPDWRRELELGSKPVAENYNSTDMSVSRMSNPRMDATIKLISPRGLVMRVRALCPENWVAIDIRQQQERLCSLRFEIEVDDILDGPTVTRGTAVMIQNLKQEWIRLGSIVQTELLKQDRNIEVIQELLNRLLVGLDKLERQVQQQ